MPPSAPLANPPVAQELVRADIVAQTAKPAASASTDGDRAFANGATSILPPIEPLSIAMEPASPAPGAPAGNRASGGATQAIERVRRKSKNPSDGPPANTPPASPFPAELPVRLILNQTAIAPAQPQAVTQTERARSAVELPVARNNPPAAVAPPAIDPVFSKSGLAFSAALTPIAAAARNSIVMAEPVPVPAPAIPEISPAPELAAAPEAQPIEKPAPASSFEETDPGSDAGVSSKSAPAPRDEPVREVAATAGSSSAGNFTGSFAQAAPTAVPPASAGNKTETPLAAAADAVRNSEPAAPPAPAAPGAPIQEIAVRIARPEAPAVDLQVTERGGEIHVAVRTADAGLQTSLREDLGTLTTSLERAGYHAETFVPSAAAPQSAAQMGSREDRQGSQQGSGRGGSQSDSSQERQQRQRPQSGPDWLEELENLK